MEKGDWVQFTGTHNPYKGNISRGTTYQVQQIDTVWGNPVIYIRLDNGTMSWIRSEGFTVKYASDNPKPLSSDEYDEIMKIQEVFSKEQP